VESRESRVELLQIKSMALSVIVRKFLVQRSSEPKRRLKYCMSEAQGTIRTAYVSVGIFVPILKEIRQFSLKF